jgi:hypothetical protein
VPTMPTLTRSPHSAALSCTLLHGVGGGVQATLYSVQATLYSVQATLYSVQATLYSVQATLYSVRVTQTCEGVAAGGAYKVVASFSRLSSVGIAPDRSFKWSCLRRPPDESRPLSVL